MHTIFWDPFYEIIFWRHRSRFIFYMFQIRPVEYLKEKMQKKNTSDTFIVVLSVLKFVLGNVQKECLITHY